MAPRRVGETAGSRAGIAARMRAALPLATALALLVVQPSAADDFGPGAQIAAACASCHGDGGDAAGSIPAIAGMDAERIAAALRAYRESELPSHVMHAVALSLSESEILGVARYLAGQPKAGAP